MYIINTQIESVLESLWRSLVLNYEKLTKKSKELFERSRKVLPGGVTYPIRYFKPYPIYIKKAKGTRVWDVDENEYLDLWMGHGAHILGHSPDFIIEKVAEVMRNGTHLGFENIYAVEYAELLTRVIPNVDMVRFTNSGTEANMHAIRLARAYTKRTYVIKMEGGWHGAYDALHVGVKPPFKGPETLGLPEDYIKYTIVVPFNDLNALEKALKQYEAAAIILEPVLGAGGCLEPDRGYLEGVRKLADEYGALLIFDEVITGFRLALGGGQEFFNVKADVVVLGKIVGGGFPGAGAYAAKAEIMELLDQVKIPSGRERSVQAGTFTGNPITMVAGYTMIKYLAENKSKYEEFNSLWNYAIRKIDKVCEEHDRMCWTTGAGSMVGIHFTTKRPRNVRETEELRWSVKVNEVLHLYMRINKILYISEHKAHVLPSMLHTKEDVDEFIQRFAEFVELISSKIKRN